MASFSSFHHEIGTQVKFINPQNKNYLQNFHIPPLLGSTLFPAVYFEHLKKMPKSASGNWIWQTQETADTRREARINKMAQEKMQDRLFNYPRIFTKSEPASFPISVLNHHHCDIWFFSYQTNKGANYIHVIIRLGILETFSIAT